MPPSSIARLAACARAHASAASLAEYALIGNHIVVGLSAEVLGGNLLQFLDGVGGRDVGCTSHRVSGLAAARGASPREVPRGLAPGDFNLLPWHSDHFGGDAVAIVYRLGSQIADTALHVHVAIRLDDKQSVESDGTAYERAGRDADAADFGAAALGLHLALIPVEQLTPAVERFANEAAGDIGPLAANRRANFRLARGALIL